MSGLALVVNTFVRLSYEGVRPDESAELFPVFMYSFFWLGFPLLLLGATLMYLVLLNLHRPFRIFSRWHLAWALGLGILPCAYIGLSAWNQLAAWQEAVPLAVASVLFFASLEAGFLAGCTVAHGINRAVHLNLARGHK